jgi:tellurite resistance protein TehA-like permease
MENKNRKKLSYGTKLSVCGIISVGILVLLALLLKDTGYVSLVPVLVIIAWGIGLFFTAKYFIRMINDFFKKK